MEWADVDWSGLTWVEVNWSGVEVDWSWSGVGGEVELEWH